MSNYSRASRGAQWFANAKPGASMRPTKVVLHTTEGASWPGYGGGSSAPHYTARPSFSQRRLTWRAHFPDEMNSRALVNAPGGVETNTAGAVQVELIGTCDDKHAVSWPGVGRAGVDYIYWPDAPEWALRDLGAFLADMNRRHSIPLRAPSVWLRYGKDSRRPGVWPASYGASPARMSFTEWRGFRGVCGHQHVPENSHGDPGALDIDKALAYARGGRTNTSGDIDVDKIMKALEDLKTRIHKNAVDTKWLKTQMKGARVDIADARRDAAAARKWSWQAANRSGLTREELADMVKDIDAKHAETLAAIERESEQE